MIQAFKKYIFLLLIVGLGSCGGSDSSDPAPDEPNFPGKAQGTLPANGEPCSEFEEVPGDPSKASIFFKWTSAEFTRDYELKVFEGQNEVLREIFTSLETSIVLDKGKSYSWSVTTKNDEGETSSDTFSFTTPGEPVGNYAPYAAEITISFNIATSQMSLSWLGSDEDGDSLTYDVSIWQDGELLVTFNDLLSGAVDNVAVVQQSQYDIEVTSKDGFGNFSISKTSKTFSE